MIKVLIGAYFFVFGTYFALPGRSVMAEHVINDSFSLSQIY